MHKKKIQYISLCILIFTLLVLGHFIFFQDTLKQHSSNTHSITEKSQRVPSSTTTTTALKNNIPTTEKQGRFPSSLRTEKEKPSSNILNYEKILKKYQVQGLIAFNDINFLKTPFRAIRKLTKNPQARFDNHLGTLLESKHGYFIYLPNQSNDSTNKSTSKVFINTLTQQVSIITGLIYVKINNPEEQDHLDHLKETYDFTFQEMNHYIKMQSILANNPEKTFEIANSLKKDEGFSFVEVKSIESEIIVK